MRVIEKNKKRGLLMDKLRAEFKRVLNDTFGPRLNDGKCHYCGKDLNGNYCDCLKAKKINRYYKKVANKFDSFCIFLNDEEFAKHKSDLSSRTKIPAKYRGMDFEDFRTETPEQKKVYQFVNSYFKNAIQNFLIGKNMILTGNFGTGKTLFMSILANRLTSDFGFKVCYVNAVDLINEIKDSFNLTVKVTTKQVLDRYCNADFLFIDDIDKLNPTEYVRELMYSIVNTRYENEMAIVVSSNNPIEILDEKFFGEAVVSRILERSIEVQFNSKNARFE